MEKCICCGKKPIKVKKWRRCIKCYRVYRKMPGFKHNIMPTKHLSEVEFVRGFFDHKNWIYQPANFRFNGEKYQPDFYDGERNIFIEVVGTKQAYYANRKKYKQFQEAYPKINFEIRLMNGDLIDLNEKLNLNKD